MHHGRCLFVFRHEFLGPGTSLIILIPVPTIGQIHTLRHIQAQCMDVIHKDQHTGHLHFFHQAEFVRRLDRVHRIATGIG